MRKLTHSAGSRIFNCVGRIRLLPLSLIAGVVCSSMPIQASQTEPADSERFSVRSLTARSRGESMAQWILRRSSPYITVSSTQAPAEIAPSSSRTPVSAPSKIRSDTDPLADFVRPGKSSPPETKLFQAPQTPVGLNAHAMRKLRRYDEPVQKYAQINGLDPNLIRAVIYVESAGDPKAMSRKGAQGLMQLMPETAHDMGVADAFNPAQNIFGGSRYLSGLIDRFDRVDLALWAYNAGPGSVQKRRLPMETKKYIPEVLRVKSALDAWGL